MTKPNSSEPLMDEKTARFRAMLRGEEDEESPKKSAPPRPARDRRARPVKPSAPPPEPPYRPPADVSSAVTPPPSADSGTKSGKRQFGPAFWTVTGLMSLAVNAVLIALVLILFGQVSQMKSMLGAVTNLQSLPLDTVRGLYKNFELMEKAHIVTQIPVSTTVPVKLDVCIKTGTQVIINQRVTIPDAKVTVQTGGLNITNATTRIELPADTVLPVNLDLCVPVETTIPVSLNVNVDIPLANTDLNAPFIGLKNVIAPLYCLLDKQALTDHNTLVCNEVPKK